MPRAFTRCRTARGGGVVEHVFDRLLTTAECHWCEGRTQLVYEEDMGTVTCVYACNT